MSPMLRPRSLPFTTQILILTHQHLTAFENIVGKREIARKEQFLLFPLCFLLNQIYRICHELTVEIYRICHELTVKIKLY